MANTLDPMDLKQIITLHLDSSSNRDIAETLGISRNTVNNYIRLFKASEYTFKELLSFDIGKVESLFHAYHSQDDHPIHLQASFQYLAFEFVLKSC